MFERFTDGARRIVMLGQEEARRLNHNYIGTEHLLLALTHEDGGMAARALQALGISLPAVRQQVEETIGRGQMAQSGHYPFTPRAKKAVELARQEAESLGHTFINPEHLLLGVVREGDGVASQVLVRMGADLASVRQQVILLITGRAWPGTTGGRPRRMKGRARQIDDALANLGLVDRRLAAIERWVGMAPAFDDLDQEIAHVRSEKESAISSQDFESAATLRDKEEELVRRRISRESEWMAATGDNASIAEELGRVQAELERLSNIVRQHGIDDSA